MFYTTLGTLYPFTLGTLYPCTQALACTPGATKYFKNSKNCLKLQI